MDEWTLNHMNKWLSDQFNEDEADLIRPAMITTFNDDPEYWSNESYWEVYEAARPQFIDALNEMRA